MGLLRTRQQGHTVESIRQAMVELRERFPLAGAREMSSLLFHERDMSVSRYEKLHSSHQSHHLLYIFPDHYL